MDRDLLEGMTKRRPHQVILFPKQISCRANDEASKSDWDLVNPWVPHALLFSAYELANEGSETAESPPGGWREIGVGRSRDVAQKRALEEQRLSHLDHARQQLHLLNAVQTFGWLGLRATKPMRCRSYESRSSSSFYSHHHELLESPHQETRRVI